MSHDLPPIDEGDAVPTGTRVQLIAASGGGTGCVIEDFGPLPDDGAVHLDAHTTIRPRRYAVALDGGSLVFVNDDEFDTTSDG